MDISSMRLWFRLASAGVLVVSMGILAGCGGSKKGVSVSGKVTYPTAEQPVTGGTISFHPPAGGKSQPFLIHLNADGTYSAMDVPLGEMKVTVETESIRGSVGGGASPYKSATGAPVPLENGVQIDTSKLANYRKIPKKYADPNTTPLTLTVVAGKQTKDFNLTD